MPNAKSVNLAQTIKPNHKSIKSPSCWGFFCFVGQLGSMMIDGLSKMCDKIKMPSKSITWHLWIDGG